MCASSKYYRNGLRIILQCRYNVRLVEQHSRPLPLLIRSVVTIVRFYYNKARILQQQSVEKQNIIIFSVTPHRSDALNTRCRAVVNVQLC